MNANTEWLAWWDDADLVVRGVFVVLIALSVSTWWVILYKAAQLTAAVRRERAASRMLAGGAPLADLAALAGNGTPSAHLAVETSRLTGDLTDLEARLGQVVRERRLELESGLTLLATIGNAAPFIGLLGTVWGIMHALQSLDSDAAVSLEMVAGPVAEALVATAAGLFAAIPAVVGYNLLLRLLRRVGGATEGNAVRILSLIRAGEA